MNYIDEDNLMILTHSPIVGSAVKTPDNKVIGEISGVMLNTFTGDVPYALVSLYANNKSLKNRHIAISWKDFEDKVSQKQEFVLDVKKIKWKDLAYFNPGYESFQNEAMNSTSSQQIWNDQYASYANQ